MHIELNGEQCELVMARLTQVFGIQNFTHSIAVEKDMDKVHEVALQLMNETAPHGIRVKVNTRRSELDFALDTHELNLDRCDFLTDKRPDLVVQMQLPDMILRVEVRREDIYLSK